MSVARPLRCVVLASRAARPTFAATRPFQSSSQREKETPSRREKPLVMQSNSDSSAIAEQIADISPTYTSTERKKLAQKYTPEQMEILDAGEEAVDSKDIWEQGSVRNDPMAIDYLDDFSTIRTHIDHKPTKSKRPYNSRIAKLAPKNPDAAFDAEGVERAMLGGENINHILSGDGSHMEHALPKFTDPLMRRMARAGHQDAGSESAQFLAQLSKQTGLATSRLKQLRVKKLVQHRVANQTRMGKIAKQYVLMIAGDRKGLLGIGEGSAVESEQAVMKARRNAIRGMVPIPRYENRTIFGDVKGKVGATELEMFTRPPGFGIRCSEKIFEMCKCAGISDISARVTRSRNPMNTIKAAFQALLSQRDPEQVSRARGRKMVDVRKVYYAGNV